MYRKLAWRNIHRSIRDYAIYFVTLVVGVAIFYAFNSVEGQQALLDIESGTQQRMIESTQAMLNMVSVLVACVLGFLVIYANQFLIKRRKREFGIYLTLGMSPSGVSRIVLYETAMVGLVSLVVGLLIGIALSQGMSFITASMFGTTMRAYHFVVSAQAIVITALCFAVVYAVVAVFNLFSVGRLTLASLLTAGSRNQRNPVRNPLVCLMVFIAAVACLAYAYQQLIENGMVMLDAPEFQRATLFMLLGSLLFFWSLAGFVIAVLTRARGVYLRGLVPFTVRQIASRVNTAFLSLWVVCVMLFFAITIFSGGMGMIEVFVGDVYKANPYSATLRADIFYDTNGKPTATPHAATPDERAQQMREADPETYAAGMAEAWSIAEPLQAAAPELWTQTVAASAQIDLYELPGVTYDQLRAQLPNGGEGLLSDDFERATESNVITVSVSQVNALRALTGADPVQLAEGECLFVNNMAPTEDLAGAIADAGVSFDALGTRLAFGREVLEMQFDDNAMLSSALYVVVPDAVTESLKAAGAIPNTSYLDVMYADNGRTEVQNDEAMGQILAAAQPLGEEAAGNTQSEGAYQGRMWPVTMFTTANEMITQSSGLRMLITYLAIYIGFVLLVATAAVLAIQALSLAADSEPRYRMLNRLGADVPMLNRSLLAQTLIYFLVPLGLAVCHSVCAIGVLGKSMFSAFLVDATTPALMAAGLVLVVYGIYFLVTYFASRSIVKKAVKVS